MPFIALLAQSFLGMQDQAWCKAGIFSGKGAELTGCGEEGSAKCLGGSAHPAGQCLQFGLSELAWQPTTFSASVQLWRVRNSLVPLLATH